MGAGLPEEVEMVAGELVPVHQTEEMWFGESRPV